MDCRAALAETLGAMLAEAEGAALNDGKLLNLYVNFTDFQTTVQIRECLRFDRLPDERPARTRI
jgi:hypothetical protein